MADIREIIWENYQIDIREENLIKLYNLENRENITEAELRVILAEKKAEWEKNAMNLTLESARKKIQERLEKTKKYEEILLNKKYRKAIFAYGKGGKINQELLEYAKTYFRVVATTKKINQKDVDFFFAYLKGEYKVDKDTKDAILTLLKDEYRYSGRNKKKGENVEEDDGDAEESQKEGNRVDQKESRDGADRKIIVNLFSKETIMGIHACECLLKKSFAEEMVRERLQMTSDSLYTFLEMNHHDSVEQLTTFIEEKRNQVFKMKQEYGNEYTEIVNAMNKLVEIVKKADVIDNYNEFCLLLKYSKLTPFMYAFVEMKQTTIKQLLEYAQTCYFFRDMDDFILNYFAEIYDNFGINIQSIKPLMKKAEKSAAKNRVLNEMNKRLGIDNTRKMPFGINLVHWLAYLPVYLFFYIFEALKFIFHYLKYLAIPVGAGVFGFLQYVFSKPDEMGNITTLFLIFNKEKWVNYLGWYGEVYSTLSVVILTIMAWLFFLIFQIVPPIIAGLFVHKSVGYMSKEIDWIGYDRTIKRILNWLRQRTEKMYFGQKKQWVLDVIKRLVVNLVGFLLIGLVFCAVGNRLPKPSIHVAQNTAMPSYEVNVNESTDDVSQQEVVQGEQVKSEASLYDMELLESGTYDERSYEEMMQQSQNFSEHMAQTQEEGNRVGVYRGGDGGNECYAVFRIAEGLSFLSFDVTTYEGFYSFSDDAIVLVEVLDYDTREILAQRELCADDKTIHMNVDLRGAGTIEVRTTMYNGMFGYAIVHNTKLCAEEGLLGLDNNTGI